MKERVRVRAEPDVVVLAHRTARSRAGRRNSVVNYEDLAQDALLALLKASARGKAVDNRSAFLVGAVKLLHQNEIRRRRRASRETLTRSPENLDSNRWLEPEWLIEELLRRCRKRLPKCMQADLRVLVDRAAPDVQVTALAWSKRRSRLRQLLENKLLERVTEPQSGHRQGVRAR